MSELFNQIAKDTSEAYGIDLEGDFVHCLCCDEVFREITPSQDCPYCGCKEEDSVYLSPEADDYEDLIDGVE